MNKHWTQEFYKKAYSEGFKFAVRQHISNFCSGVDSNCYKLKTKKEMWKLPFIKKWKENEIFEGHNLPKRHPQSFRKWELRKYTKDEECLLIVHLKDGSYWVVGYFMDLKKFKIEYLEKELKQLT